MFDEEFCNFVFNELWGGVFWYVNFLVFVKYFDVVMGFIIMEFVDIFFMLGFNLICVVIVLLEIGLILMWELFIEF